MKSSVASIVSLVFVCLFFISGTVLQSSEASLLPFLDNHSRPQADLFDPFKVLEQIPFGVDHGSKANDLMSRISPVRVDWKETTDTHQIILDIPGLNKEEVKIEVEEDNRVLTVSGERKKEEEKKGDHWHRVERSYGKFWRQFKLPVNADMGSVKGKLENGVLTVCMKKLAKEKIKGPRVVNILEVDSDKGKNKVSSSSNTSDKDELK